MATIAQLLQNAGRKIFDRGLDLVSAWYEVTKYAPTNLHL
jgi:hypothetical protein